MRVEHGIGSKAAPGWIQSKKPQGAERLVNRLPHRVVEADLLELIGRDIGSTFPGLRVYHPGRRSDEQRMVGAHKELAILECRNDRQRTRVVRTPELLYALTDAVKAWRREKGVCVLRPCPRRAPQREK